MKILAIAILSIVAAVFGVCTEQTAKLPLRVVNDVPLSGHATRLDYQSFDAQSGRLYIAHLGDDMLSVFDTNAGKVVGDVKDLKRVHGVRAVPELHRVYASATGTDELAVIDDQTLQVVARVPAGDYPDGIAYASKAKKLYVSDLHGKTDTVIDATNNRRVATIQKQPGANTLEVTEQIETTLANLKATLPPDVTIDTKAFQQADFIIAPSATSTARSSKAASWSRSCCSSSCGTSARPSSP